jgi:tetratricopeptide (TPR) repeat protein
MIRVKTEPCFAFAYNDRCYARALADRELQLAVADCNEALKLMPNDIHILDSRGLTYLKLGDFDKAIADYSAILKVNSSQATSLYGRGIAKRKKGDNQGGEIDIAAAKNLRPQVEAEFARDGVK